MLFSAGSFGKCIVKFMKNNFYDRKEAGEEISNSIDTSRNQLLNFIIKLISPCI